MIAILRLAVLRDRPALVISTLICALLASAVLGTLQWRFGAGQLGRQLFSIIFPLGLLSLIFWSRYIVGATRQYTPANVQLVPGLRALIRRTTVLAWCLALLPVLVLAPFMAHTWLALLVWSLVLSISALDGGGRSEGSVLYILGVIAVPAATQPAIVTALSGQTALSILTLLCAALACYAMQAVFPSNPDRHWALYNKQKKKPNLSTLLSWKKQGLARAGARPLYARLLQRDLDPLAARAPLLLHALGPGSHRLDFVVPLMVASLVLGLAWLAVQALGFRLAPNTWLGPEMVVLMLGAVGSMAGLLYRFIPAMQATAAEQALVRLAPSMPRAGQLNRVLARQVLRIAMREWLLCCAVIVASVMLLGGGWREMMTVASMACGALALCGVALRDYSGKSPNASSMSLVQIALVASATLIVIYLIDQPALWLAGMLALALGVGLLIAWRWHRMIAAPVAFPSSRY